MKKLMKDTANYVLSKSRRANASVNMLIKKRSSWWQSAYRQPVYDLGLLETSKSLHIYSPQYDESLVKQYVHEQFLEGAEKHSEKYVLYDLYENNLRQAFKRISLVPSDRKLWKVLDIGSGSGNTILPLLKIFPNIKLLATEFSIPMLVALKKVLHQYKQTDHCDLLQLNAEDLDFKPKSFDLVVGGAILHHLFSPEKTIEGCSRILKPGGYAIFFEPFLYGNAFLSLVFETIIDRGMETDLDPEIIKYLREWIKFIDMVKGEDKTEARFLSIDDKWLFTRSYFTKYARQYGFKECSSYTLYSTKNQFENQVRTILQIYGGFSKDIIPNWVWEMVREYDSNLSTKQKENLIIEGCVIFKK